MFLFVVNEKEMAVVLRFGALQRPISNPGVYFKAPFIDNVQRISKVKQFWGDSSEHMLPDLPTKDDKKIELIPWAIWRVSDPGVFVAKMRDMTSAENRVDQTVRSVIRDIVTQYDLEEIVRSSDRPLPVADNSTNNFGAMKPLADITITEPANAKPKKIQIGRPEILSRIKTEAQKRLAESADLKSNGRGIEILDVGISQIGFVDSVRKKTFDRWIAERQSISSRNSNEGERLKANIINETKAEVEKIEGEGEQRSSGIRGETDAKIIKLYADAMQQTSEFYTYVRTLEAYEKGMTGNTQLILSTDSPFFKIFKDMK